jgi:transposase
MDPMFRAVYSDVGRPGVPPEKLLRALLLQVLYTVRSERLLCEQLDYNLLFRLSFPRPEREEISGIIGRELM